MPYSVPKTKVVHLMRLTSDVKALVAALEGCEETETTVNFRRQSGEFTPEEQASITAIWNAHDGQAIKDADAANKTQVRHVIDELVQGYQDWDTLLPTQQLAICKKMLRVFIFKLRGR